MLDLVSGDFFENQGLGIFIKGDYIYKDHYVKTPVTIYDDAYEELLCIENHISPFPTEPAVINIQPSIDLDYCANNNNSFEFKYSVDDLRGSSKVNGNTIFQASNTSWTNAGVGFYSYQGTTGTWYQDFNNSEKSISGGYAKCGGTSPDDIFVIQQNRWDKKDGSPVELYTRNIHVNDDPTGYAQITTTDEFQTRRSLWLFRAQLSNWTPTSTANYYSFSGKFYYFKCWEVIDGVDTLVIDLVPAKRLTDGKIGLYDKARNRFFSNCNSEAEKDFIGTPKDNPTYIKDYVTYYDQAEYILTDGSQYYDTGIKANQDTSIECKYEFTTDEGNNCVFFGATQSLSTDSFSWYRDSTNIYDGYGNENIELGHEYSDGLHILYKNKEKTYVDGDLVYTHEQQEFESDNNIIIGNILNQSNSYNIKGKIYYIKIWQGDELVRDLRPVGPIGCLYDRVEGIVLHSANKPEATAYGYDYQ